MKHPGGRPTKYSKVILDKTSEYLETYEHLGDAIPSVAGLSVFLGISRQTIYEWSSQDDKKEFSDILQDILSDQERVLINKGLKGEFNANIAKLALGKHGYSDKQDITSDGKRLPAPIMPIDDVRGNNSNQEDKESNEED